MSRTRRLKPWITLGLINSTRKSDQMKRLLYKQPFNCVLKMKCIKYRNFIHSLLKRAKSNYYRYKIESTAGYHRKFWAVVKEVSGHPLSKDIFLLEVFWPDGDAMAPDRAKMAIRTLGPEEGWWSFKLRPVTNIELAVLRSIMGRSAPGWDDIPAQLMKDKIQFLSEPLLQVINLCIQTGQFPDPFKVAPVFK